ncbi:hypothetical protein RQP46_001770 [Phenoliferia psychrophenolica]
MSLSTPRRSRSSTLSSGPLLESLSESSVASLSSRPRPSPTPSYQSRPRHRHSATSKEALELLQQLGDQATTPKLDDHIDHEDQSVPDQGVIANLESHGWIYHGWKSGVHIFSKDEDEDGNGRAEDREGSHGSGSRTTAASTAGTGIEGRAKGKQGIRAGEKLPYFRGEAFIEGSWRPDDVAAVIKNFGSRAVWDPRCDSLHSSVVKILSPTDALAHLHIRGTFPVGPRDAVFVSTEYEQDSRTSYYAARSVEDSLLPKKGTRTTIHLNGYCIRSVDRSPHFEPPPKTPPIPTPEGASPPMRPSHRRTKSSISGLGPPPLSQPFVEIPVVPTLNKRPSYNFPGSAPPPRPPSLALSNRQRSSSSSSSVQRGGHLVHHSSYGVIPAVSSPQEYALSKTTGVIPPSQLAGIYVSFIARSSPGGNLPQTYVNSLSLALPLGLSHIDRYLHAHGFPPHIERSSRLPGLDVLSESYDVAGGLYTLVFRIRASLSLGETRVRFFGSAFSRGNFTVEMFRAKGWRIEYDVFDPECPPVETWEDDNDEDERPGARQRSCLSVLAGLPPPLPTPPPRLASHSSTNFAFPFPARPSSSTRSSASASAPPILDSAKLPGPAGGCTLIIPNSPVAGCMPVTLSISKNQEAARATMDSLLLGGALGRAASVGVESSLGDSIEQMIGGSPEGQAQLVFYVCCH